ncbi:MAG: AAA family ATPase [Planctomycetes bacterium]|nr:AAA family ATPase [Planctomycetota bacterium]
MNFSQLSQQSIDDVLAWASDQPWCRAMANCQQDADWHAEGDVWTHTKMVCSQLPRVEGWESLSPRERTLLLFTALFHDSAKPLTSRLDLETGRIQSPRHAVKGEQLARNVLRELQCELVTREEIARLVRYHGRPAFLLSKPNPGHEVVSLSWLVSNKLLFMFALADTRGRDTESMSRPEENVHFWKLAAEEYDCFEKPYAFANDQARFLFYRRPNPELHYVPHEEYRCTVTMMSGLPGSGKDTWLYRHRHGLPVVSLDEIRGELDVQATDNQGHVIQVSREQCRELMRSGTSFAFSATNVQPQTRSRWIDLFADYGARVEIVYIEPALSTILAQNRRRERQVPERVIRELAEGCEPPTWTEGHGLAVYDGVLRET